MRVVIREAGEQVVLVDRQPTGNALEELDQFAVVNGEHLGPACCSDVDCFMRVTVALVAKRIAQLRCDHAVHRDEKAADVTDGRWRCGRG